MAHVEVNELFPDEVAASVEARRIVDEPDLQTWLADDLSERVALCVREDGRMVGLVLGGVRGDSSSMTAFGVHPMAGAPVAVAFLLLGALARRLGPVAFEQCAFALRKADLTVRQAIATFGGREAAPVLAATREIDAMARRRAAVS
jgi:hypothetical protein